MTTLTHDEIVHFLALIFNLQPEDFMLIVPVCNETKNEVIVKLTPTTQYCPHCGSNNITVKDYNNRKICHQMIAGSNTAMIYSSRRYKCKSCGKTFTEVNPFSHARSRISLKTIDLIMKDLENPTETFSNVARRYHVSTTTVQRIFDEHFAPPTPHLTRHVCIDENYAYHSNDVDSNYICVLMDYDSKKIIDILPSRRLDYLSNYFRNIPKSERENVKLLCSDMFDAYRTLSNKYLNNCCHVVDHFHVVKDFYDRFDRVRISVMNQLRARDTKSDEYYLIKHFNWMLKRDDERFYDPSLPKKFNRRMNRYLNLFDIYQLLLDIHPLLTEGVNLRDELKSFFENTTSKNAKEEFSKLVKCFSESNEPEFKKFASTLIKWKWSIINYFINIGDNTNVKHISNGLLENRNKIIKEIKYNANGYRNFERFRARIFYSLNKNYDHYLINPDKEKQEYNKQRLKNNYQRHLKKIENKKPN